MNEPDKRYLLFSFSEYYPSGGLSDVKKQFCSMDEFTQFVCDIDNVYDLCEYSYLYDRIDGVVVWDKDEFLKSKLN